MHSSKILSNNVPWWWT